MELVISTLSELPEAVSRSGLRAPVMIVVGQVVSLSEQLDWFQSINTEINPFIRNIEDDARDMVHA